MKKQLVVALGLTVLATPAFATKARLQALGDDIYGSFYINDNRNIWLNAATINNHKDLVTFEWGNSAVTSTNVFGQDSAPTPRAEGGVHKTIGNLVWGLHFGSASNTGNALRAGAGLSLADAAEKNNVDLFVGGDAGLKWGANIGYSSSSEAGTTGDFEQEALRTRLGVIAGDIEAYANINIMNNAEGALIGPTGTPVPGATAEFEGKLGYQVGVIYGLNDYKIYADYRAFDAEGENSAVAGSNDISLSQLQVGAGRATRLNDKATLFTRAQLTWATSENEGAAGTFAAATCSAERAVGCEEYETMRVPVVVGLEYDAASWLVLRASVVQSVWGQEEDADDERSLAETTHVNAGATLRFGEFSIDGVIGNYNASTIDNTTAGGDGVLRTDSLMTRVGMLYRF